MPKVIIIGAGVSGLCAGIYALQSGFEVEIYEKHFVAGGACTSWSRKGYTFEGAVHWLTESSLDSPFYNIWHETGILQPDVKTYRHDPYNSLEYDGQWIYLYRDIEKLRTHFLHISPKDEATINKLCADISALSGLISELSCQEGVKLLKSYEVIDQRPNIDMDAAGICIEQIFPLSCPEYVSMFSHEGIRKLLLSVIPKGYGAMSLIVTMSTFAHDGCFPEGGAQALGKRMVDKYTSAGGKLFLSSKVEEVTVTDGNATGIVVNGTHFSADAVVVTPDLITAIDSLFREPPEAPWIKKLTNFTVPQVCTLVGVGIRGTLNGLPHQIHFKPDKPISYAGVTQEILGFINYSAHPEYSPPGCTTLVFRLYDDTYNWWAAAKARGTYYQEKEALAMQIIDAISKKYPQISDVVEVFDVATPLTYERYIGSYKGSWMSVLPKDTISYMYPATCDNINSLYFAGFRMQEPGGLPIALRSGRRVAQLLCKQFDRVFKGKFTKIQP